MQRSAPRPSGAGSGFPRSESGPVYLIQRRKGLPALSGRLLAFASIVDANEKEAKEASIETPRNLAPTGRETTEGKGPGQAVRAVIGKKKGASKL